MGNHHFATGEHAASAQTAASTGSSLANARRQPSLATASASILPDAPWSGAAASGDMDAQKLKAFGNRQGRFALSTAIQNFKFGGGHARPYGTNMETVGGIGDRISFG
jgi:hypothetical protein